MIYIPDRSLILPVGVAGSGKTTTAEKLFGSHALVSSDHCRELVCGDETDQTHNRDAFALFHTILDMRTRIGVLTVADATNLRPSSRETIRNIAKGHGRPVFYMVMDVSLEEALRRNAARSRQVPEHAIRRHHELFLQQQALLSKEVPSSHIIRIPETGSLAAMSQVRVGEPIIDVDDREVWVIGDVHGCYQELMELLARIPSDALIVFAGDFVDRGPYPEKVLRLVRRLILDGRALAVMGNHDWKAYRKIVLGRNVTVNNGLEETIKLVAIKDAEYIKTLPHQVHIQNVHGQNLVVAHAGVRFSDVGKSNKAVEAHCLYGETDGTRNPDTGFPVRTYGWADTWTDPNYTCVFGHTPVEEVQYLGPTKNCVNVDTGCAFGGKLTAYNPFTGETMQVNARRAYADRVGFNS